MDMQQIVMEIIIQSGEARAYAHEALRKAYDGEFEEADKLIAQANDAIEKAHNVQTSMLQKEASGEKLEFSILFVHSQDHLMTAISEKNLILEIIELRKMLDPVLHAYASR